MTYNFLVIRSMTMLRKQTDTRTELNFALQYRLHHVVLYLNYAKRSQVNVNLQTGLKNKNVRQYVKCDTLRNDLHIAHLWV